MDTDLEVLLVAFDSETRDLYNRFILQYVPVDVEKKNENDCSKGEIVVAGRGLLDIFVTEEDKNGTNLAQKSDFFGTFIGKKLEKMNLVDMSIASSDIGGLLGQITSAIIVGFDVSNSNCLCSR